MCVPGVMLNFFIVLLKGIFFKGEIRGWDTLASGKGLCQVSHKSPPSPSQKNKVK